MKIGVIGGGAIGLLISAYLARHHQVTVYARREEQVKLIRKNGVLLQESGKKANVSSARSANLNDEDLLFVCVKQLHIPSVVSYLLKVDQRTPIIFLQNGMGHIDVMKQLKQPLILGTVDHGALKINDYTVSHTGKGSISIAAYTENAQDQLEMLQKALHQTDFMFQSKADWYYMLADKLIVNAVINPVTALFQVKNGAILDQYYMQKIAKELCREAAAVLQLDFNHAWERVRLVAMATAENTSSMAKDVMEKRQTEIKGITGYILQKNTTLQLPYTTFIYYSIKAIEEIEET